MQQIQLQASHVEFTTLMYFGAAVVKTIPMYAYWYYITKILQAKLVCKLGFPVIDMTYSSPIFRRA